MSGLPAVALCRSARTVIEFRAWEVKARENENFGLLERDMVDGAESEMDTSGAGVSSLRVSNVIVLLLYRGSHCRGSVSGGGSFRCILKYSLTVSWESWVHHWSAEGLHWMSYVQSGFSARGSKVNS